LKNNHLDNLIVRHLAGSQAYGTSTPTSDTDFRGIFVADKEFIITPFFKVNEVSDVKEEDTKYYELNNYMQLYLTANPNILESLWVDEGDITFKTEMYDHLRAARSDLLSSKIAFTYTGYAHNQAKRMKNHHGWMDKERTGVRILQELIDQYPCEQMVQWIGDSFPSYIMNLVNVEAAKGQYIKTIIDFEKFMRNASLQMISTLPLKQYHFVKLVHNYFEHQVLDRDFNILNYRDDYQLVPYGDNIFGLVPKEGAKTINYDGSINRIDTSVMTLEEVKEQPKLIVKFNKEEYEKSSDNRHNYHSWKENRNEARSELEQLNGYDTKHAMHVVRLLRTAEEALTTGEVHVKRPDAAELLAIRNGSWSFDEMMAYWTEKDIYIREVLYKQTDLPRAPDIHKAAKLLIELREMQWYGK
jgi:predicted nucleotidyltransferase